MWLYARHDGVATHFDSRISIGTASHTQTFEKGILLRRMDWADQCADRCTQHLPYNCCSYWSIASGTAARDRPVAAVVAAVAAVVAIAVAAVAAVAPRA